MCFPSFCQKYKGILIKHVRKLHRKVTHDLIILGLQFDLILHIYCIVLKLPIQLPRSLSSRIKVEFGTCPPETLCHNMFHHNIFDTSIGHQLLGKFPAYFVFVWYVYCSLRQWLLIFAMTLTSRLKVMQQQYLISMHLPLFAQTYEGDYNQTCQRTS